jgi:hypothetical protein
MLWGAHDRRNCAPHVSCTVSGIFNRNDVSIIKKSTTSVICPRAQDYNCRRSVFCSSKGARMHEVQIEAYPVPLIYQHATIPFSGRLLFWAMHVIHFPHGPVQQRKTLKHAADVILVSAWALQPCLDMLLSIQMASLLICVHHTAHTFAYVHILGHIFTPEHCRLACRAICSSWVLKGWRPSACNIELTQNIPFHKKAIWNVSS